MHRPRKPFDSQKCGELLPTLNTQGKVDGKGLERNFMQYPDWGLKPPDKPSMRSILNSLDSKIEKNMPASEMYLSDSERDMISRDDSKY